jgi:hypothetical protein
MNVNQNFHTFYDLGEIWCKSSEHNIVQWEFRENRRGKAVLFLWVLMKLHFHVYLNFMYFVVSGYFLHF